MTIVAFENRFLEKFKLMLSTGVLNFRRKHLISINGKKFKRILSSIIGGRRTVQVTFLSYFVYKIAS